jgi:ATP-dependent DNA helicase DinG
LKPSPLDEFFGLNGPLSQLWPNYQPREGQIRMAKAIEEAVLKNQHLVVEAGTGVGKSLAYLAPLLLNPKRGRGPVLVSTGTIALQEQLIEKDLPLLAKVLKRPITFVLAKGRNHYLCEHRFRRVAGQLSNVAEDEDDLRVLDRIPSLMGKGILGRNQLPGTLSDSAWSFIRSETGLCGHAKCREHPCSYQRVKVELKQADVVVANHSLLFVHLQLAKQGVSLLPRFKALVLDEAHHGPEVATEHFGIHVSNSQVDYLLDQLYGRKAGKGFLSRVQPAPEILKKKVVALRSTSEAFFGSLHFWLVNQGPDNGRLIAPLEIENPLSIALRELRELLENWAGTSTNQDEEREFRYFASRAWMMADEIEDFVKLKMSHAAHWLESRPAIRGKGQRVTGRSAPLDVSKTLHQILFEEVDSVIMTSATLSTSHRNPFEFFRGRMGMPMEHPELVVPSPFEYQRQVCLISSKSFPDPTSQSWLDELTPKVKEALTWTGGGTFVLTTSHFALRHLHSSLSTFCKELSYPLLAQGITGERGRLLEAFRNNPHSVLLGSSTFWEGVDIPGSNLRHIIIPRLPFEVPSHPLQEARVEDLEARGKSPFLDWALPQALIRFRQGFGRLIRQVDDQGLVTVLDPRLHTKRYGKDFINALPPCEWISTGTPPSEFLNQLFKHAKLDSN